MVRVLVAEDEAFTAMALVDTLESEGHEVRDATDGADAIRLLEEFDAQVLVTDLMMPGIDGFAVLDMTSRRRNKEFQVFITYSFAGLKPGDYVLVTKLRDRNADKSGSFELPFTIVEPAP